ncbi:MAG TPA: hypothetical protein VF519_15655 [Mycobacteriales bacterium]
MYSLAVEMADRVSARRASANSFFLTLQTGLVAGLALFATRVSDSGGQAAPDRFVLVVAAFAGVLLAGAWWLLLRSYRKLNSAKFTVINRIEQDHFTVRPFVDEWVVLRPNTDPPTKLKWRDRYAELGFIEQVTPVAFGVVYLVLATYLVVR